MLRPFNWLITLVFTLFTAEASVYFPYSEVHQENDLFNGEIAFNCDYGCKVHVSVKSTDLVITQNGNVLATFSDIIGDKSAFPAGLLMKAGTNYKIENHGDPTPFVFYSMRTDAPNFDTPVSIPQKTAGISFQGKSRFSTILNNYETMWYYDFQGNFPEGYPRIYTTGFDAANDGQCQPVYQARSQWNAENSWLIVSGAVITVDFGFEGDHRATCNQRSANDPIKFGHGSVVYMSPGHVGCSYNPGKSYYTQIKSVKDQFTVNANSLKLFAAYDSLSAQEQLYLTVNQEQFQLKDSGSITKFWDKSNLDVSISWTRSSSASSFSVQLDRGDEGISTVPTTQRSEPTTSSAYGRNTLMSMTMMILWWTK